jgi:hypothetical protein
VAASPARGTVITAAVMTLTAALVTTATQGLVYALVACGVAALGLVLLLLGTYRTGLGMLVLAFATAPVYRGIEFLPDGSGTPTDALVVVGLALLLPTVAGYRLGLPAGYLVSVVVVASTGLVAAAASGALIDFFYLAQWLFFIAGFPIVIAWWRPSTRVIAVLLWSYVAGHTVSTLYGAAEGPLGNDRYDGLTHHPNAFGLAGLAAVAILLYLFHHHQSAGVRVVVVLAGAISAASIAMSGSRASAVVAAVLIMMVPIVERSALSGFMLATGVALGAFALPLIIAISGEGSAIARLAGDTTARAADLERETALGAGFERFYDSPIVGSGFANIVTIHNVFLEVGIAIGVIGLIFYLVILFTLARPLFFDHPLRRLGYLPWAFIGICPALPGLWDRTIWVPMALAILPALRGPTPAAGKNAVQRSDARAAVTRV